MTFYWDSAQVLMTTQKARSWGIMSARENQQGVSCQLLAPLVWLQAIGPVCWLACEGFFRTVFMFFIKITAFLYKTCYMEGKHRANDKAATTGQF